MTTEEMLALRFVGDRVENFMPLTLPVKRLVLQIVDFYLDTFYPFDEEPQAILSEVRNHPSEEKMVALYKRFLEFLPIRLRSGIQGRYLYQEPSPDEKKLNEKEAVMRELTAEGVADLAADFGITDTVIKEISELQKGGGQKNTPALQAWAEHALGTPVNEEDVKKLIDTIKHNELNF